MWAHICTPSKQSPNDRLDAALQTLFYTFYGGKKIAETLNRLNFSCFTLGNHEFDGGEAPLAEFLSDLTFPTVSTNVRSQYLPLQSRLYPYIGEQGPVMRFSIRILCV